MRAAASPSRHHLLCDASIPRDHLGDAQEPQARQGLPRPERKLLCFKDILNNRRIRFQTFLLALALGVIAYKFAEESTKDQENKRAGRPTNEHDKSIRGFSLHVCRSLWGHSALRIPEESADQPTATHSMTPAPITPVEERSLVDN